jgi:hypothetical protein
MIKISSNTFQNLKNLKILCLENSFINRIESNWTFGRLDVFNNLSDLE